MLLFLIGAVCGAALLFGLLLWSAGRDADAFAAFRAHQRMADIERQTIRNLMSVERAGRRAPTRPVGTDIVEGTATDLDERP